VEDAAERAYHEEAAKILAAQRDVVETSPAQPLDQAGEADVAPEADAPHVKHDHQGRMTN
jgi:hypothetical protein